MLNIKDATPYRLLSLGVNAAEEPRILLSVVSTRGARRAEGESVTVFFGKDGAIIRGTRSAYTTGTPARRSEDRRLGLLPTDSARVRALLRAVRRVCRA